MGGVLCYFVKIEPILSILCYLYLINLSNKRLTIDKCTLFHQSLTHEHKA